MKILLASQSDKGRSPGAKGGRLVNLYAEVNPEGSKYPFTIYATPGVNKWAATGTFGEWQGGQVMGGYLYAFQNNSVYKLLPPFDVTLNARPTALGTLTGSVGRLSIANNGTQMAVVTPDGLAFIITSSTVTQITDSDFPLVSYVTFADGYFIFTTMDSGQFIISSLYEGTTYDALDFATAEEVPDNLIAGVAFNGGLFLPGTDSYEFYANTGNADFPYEQIPGAANTSRGCAAKFSIVQEDNTLFFLGNDRVVYRMQGYTPQRISTHAVESAIAKYATVSDCFSFVYTQEGHKFLVMTFPGANATHVYDISQGMWHERMSAGGRWMASFYAFFDNKHLVGHKDNGRIYELSLDIGQEEIDPIIRVAEGAVQWADDDRLTFDEIFIDVQPGRERKLVKKGEGNNGFATIPQGFKVVVISDYTVNISDNDTVMVTLDDGSTKFITTAYNDSVLGTFEIQDPLPQTITEDNLIEVFEPNQHRAALLGHADPLISFSYSTDGGITFSNVRTCSIGKTGEYKNRAVFRRCGQHRQFIPRFQFSDPEPITINGAYAKVRRGVS